jgi:predicted  nucleic acid-binding Zn-ribbon protein
MKFLFMNFVRDEYKKHKQKENRKKLSQMQKKINDLSDDNWRLERKIDELNKKRYSFHDLFVAYVKSFS